MVLERQADTYCFQCTADLRGPGPCRLPALHLIVIAECDQRFTLAHI